MTESYEIKNSRNCTIHAKYASNSSALLYIQGSYQQGEKRQLAIKNSRKDSKYIN